jgi:hypothetical protein
MLTVDSGLRRNDHSEPMVLAARCYGLQASIGAQQAVPLPVNHLAEEAIHKSSTKSNWKSLGDGEVQARQAVMEF